MKQLLLVLICLININLTYCQTVVETKKTNDEDMVFSRAEVSPAYPGGEDAFRKFLRNNIDLNNIKPDSSATSECFTITVKFIVSKDGSITDAFCENSGCGMCLEFIRVIKKSGKWLPALQNGKKVNAYHRQVINISKEN